MITNRGFKSTSTRFRDLKRSVFSVKTLLWKNWVQHFENSQFGNSWQDLGHISINFLLLNLKPRLFQTLSLARSYTRMLVRQFWLYLILFLSILFELINSLIYRVVEIHQGFAFWRNWKTKIKRNKNWNRFRLWKVKHFWIKLNFTLLCNTMGRNNFWRNNLVLAILQDL